MAFSKSYGPLTISEDGGVAKLTAGLSTSLGGGSIAGVVKASADVNVEISAIHLADAGLLYLEGKFPNFAAEIALLKAAIDAEVSKL